MAYDSTYSAISAVNSALGYEALKYDSTYDAALALLLNLGGEDKGYDSLYSIMSEMARMAENGEIGGGGSGSSASGGLISDEDLIELAAADSYNYDYYGQKYKIVNQSVAQVKMMPYVYDYDYDEERPLRDYTYNTETSEWEYVKNNDGEDAYFETSSIFQRDIEPGLRRGDYNVKPNAEGLPSDGNLILNPDYRYSNDPNWYGSHPYYFSSFGDKFYQNFGFSKDGEYRKPYQNILSCYSGESYSTLSFTNDNGNVDLEDLVNPWSRQELRLMPCVVESPYRWGTYPIPSEKFVYTGQDPIPWFKQSWNYELVNIGSFLNPLNKPFEHLQFSGINSNLFCFLNAPIDLKFDVSRTLNSAAQLSFADSPKIKSIEMNVVNDNYPSKSITLVVGGCTGLESITYNSSNLFGANLTNMYNMFGSCTSLKTIPQMDTSSVTNMGTMFYNCSSLETIPQMDTSSVTSMNYMFYNCPSLKTIPQMDTSSVTNMEGMLYNCTSLKTIPQMDTSSVTNMYNMFGSCTSLTSIPQMDTSSVTNANYIFGYSYLNDLTDLGGFKNLSISITSNFLDRCPNLTVESLMNVINNLATVSGKTLSFGSTNLAKLTADQIAVATNKGWTLS